MAPARPIGYDPALARAEIQQQKGVLGLAELARRREWPGVHLLIGDAEGVEDALNCVFELQQGRVWKVRGIGWCGTGVGNVAMLPLGKIALPAPALAARHGSAHGSAGRNHSRGAHYQRSPSQKGRQPSFAGHGRGNQRWHRRDARRGRNFPVRHRGYSGTLSPNAYWKAANSPTPPLPGRNATLYYEKLQIWRAYHPAGN
jgi:hypothetical protein